MRAVQMLSVVSVVSLTACAQKAMEPEDRSIAAVMLVQGDVSIRGPSGESAPAVVGLGLIREDIVKMPGLTLLFDPLTMFPLTTPPARLPVAIGTTIQPQPPGVRLVMQAAGWDIPQRRVYTTQRRAIYW